KHDAGGPALCEPRSGRCFIATAQGRIGVSQSGRTAAAGPARCGRDCPGLETRGNAATAGKAVCGFCQASVAHRKILSLQNTGRKGVNRGNRGHCFSVISVDSGSLLTVSWLSGNSGSLCFPANLFGDSL